MRSDATRLSGGRLAALLLLASGVLTIVNNYIPGSEYLDKGVLNLIGGVALLIGAGAWVAPWDRWHPRASLVLSFAALAMIGIANYFGGVSPYSYAVYFVVVFVWVGTAHPPGTSVLLAPLAVVAYVLPLALESEAATGGMPSVTVAVPVCVLVGETVARAMRRLRTAQADSERHATMLATVAASARSMNSLDPGRVLDGVVDAAIDLGFEAAEICEFDDAGGYRILRSRGLPEDYVKSVFSPGTGLAAEVRDLGRSIVVENYAAFTNGVVELREAGFRFVIGAPIWVGAEVVATLIAGTRDATRPGGDIEVFEMLPVLAGRALENARRFEEERRAVERLAELDRIKDDFISTASHELRTPLTVIDGMGKTLERQWAALSEQERLELLLAMNKNTTRLVDIVRSLLDFSRLEARAQPERSAFRLLTSATDVLSRLEGVLGGHSVQLQVPEDLVVLADPTLIERVLENIVSNAAKHTPPGTTVTIAAELRGAQVWVDIRDDGPGIPAEDLPRIGERFFRGQAGRAPTVPGTGLGLALVREILAQHGSDLHVGNGFHGGAHFWFSLPAGERERSRDDAHARAV